MTVEPYIKNFIQKKKLDGGGAQYAPLMGVAYKDKAASSKFLNTWLLFFHLF